MKMVSHSEIFSHERLPSSMNTPKPGKSAGSESRTIVDRC